MRGALIVGGCSLGRAVAVALAIASTRPKAPAIEPFGEVSAQVSLTPSLLHQVVDALKPEPPSPRTDADRRRMTRAQVKRNRKDAARAARGH